MSKKNKDTRVKGSTYHKKPEVREVKLEELKAILERAKTGVLNEQDVKQLEAAVDTLAFLTSELEKKGVSVERLRKLIFGLSSEKTRDVFEEGKKDKPQNDLSDAQDSRAEASSDGSEEQKPKRPGHGRRPASQYRGAQKIKVAHQKLKSGDACPECERGKLYEQSEPSVLVRVKGMAPLAAVVYELERLRCNLCGQVLVLFGLVVTTSSGCSTGSDTDHCQQLQSGYSASSKH